MTIALGILPVTGGVVIAADTEEVAGYMKSAQSKIVTVLDGLKPPRGACAIAGAGDAGYIDALTQELADVFMDDRERAGKPLQLALGKCVRNFHLAHVVPFAAYPPEERPRLDLLLGVQRKYGSKLYVTSNTSIRSAFGPYAAIGVGAPFAKVLLDRLWGQCDVRIAQILATYVVFMVKEHIPDCGKFTHVTTLHGPVITSTNAGAQLNDSPDITSDLSWKEVDDLERLFRFSYARHEHIGWWKFISENVKVDGPTLKTRAKPSVARWRKRRAGR